MAEDKITVSRRRIRGLVDSVKETKDDDNVKAFKEILHILERNWDDIDSADDSLNAIEDIIESRLKVLKEWP